MTRDEFLRAVAKDAGQPQWMIDGIVDATLRVAAGMLCHRCERKLPLITDSDGDLYHEIEGSRNPMTGRPYHDYCDGGPLMALRSPVTDRRKV